MRTIVVSDLHLGKADGNDLLRREDLREPLLAAIGECDRLVILGDGLELRESPHREAAEIAAPFFAAAGAALGAGGELLVLAGNHDHGLAAGWIDARLQTEPAGFLGLEQRYGPRESGPLAERLADAARPARLTLAYPGVWLRDDVYATHGHYLDRHITVPTIERLSASAMGRLVGPVPAAATPDDYEAALAPIYAWSHAMAQHAAEDAAGTHGVSLRAWHVLSGNGHRPLRRRALAALFPLSVAAFNRAGLGPFRADVSVEELGRAGVRAMGEVVDRLGVEAAHVVYGHTHRAGPRTADDQTEWTSPRGVRLHNAGCWVQEWQFAGGRPYDSPYWPGTALRVEAEGAPVAVRVLEGMGHGDLI